MGVAVGSGGGGVAVGGAIGVELGSGAGVSDGGGGVAVGWKALVSVEGGNGVQVGPEGSIVGVSRRAVAVGGGWVGETETTIGVGVEAGDKGVPLHSRTRARINRKMATINLKRSYPGARVEASMDSP
jgi:hypothetical protein